MRKLALLAGLLTLAVTPAAVHASSLPSAPAWALHFLWPAKPHHHPCRTLTVSAWQSRSAQAGEQCSRNSTPNAVVNGRTLTVGELTASHDGAVFYGDETMVSIHQSGGRVTVRAVTLLGRVNVRVWFGRYTGSHPN